MTYLKCFNCKEDLGWDKDDYKGSNNVGDMPLCEACNVWCCGKCYNEKIMRVGAEEELCRHVECKSSVDLA